MIEKIRPINLPKIKPMETESVPKKQSLKEWAAAGGGVPTQYKGREHVRHGKVKRFAAGGEVHMQKGGDPLDEFSPPRYRSAGRRPESQNDRRAAANMPVDFARGVASGVLGAPGDIESFVRMIPGLDERTVLPTSEEIEKRIPLRSDTPAGRAASGLGILSGGFYTGPGAPIRLVGGIPQAVYKAGKDFVKAAGQPATKIGPSRLSKVKEAIRQSSGDYAARRLERAADEIPNLEKLYKEEAIRRAFTGDNAKAVATMNPKDFQKYAIEVQGRSNVGPEAAAMAKKGDISKATVSTDEYIKHLQRVKGGFDDVPFLQLFKDEIGVPSKPRISSHEGRHRNMAMAENQEPAGLVQVFTRGDLREGLPRSHQDEYINALKDELELSGNLVFPESSPMYGRPPVDFPDVYAKGGEVHMGIGGAAKEVVGAGIKGVKKLLGVADEVPKGVEPIVVRTPEERAVMEKWGQKQEQEAARKKKVEKADKAAKESAGKAPEESGKPPKSTGKRVAVPPDVYRRMAETQGDEAVLRAARAGKHLKPTDGGYIGAPRTVTSGQGLGAMRKGMDTDFADSVEAVRLADPERLGTWYDRAKQGIAESTEPYQLPRTLEQHAVYSAGVSPESELTFALKHLNSRVAGEPQMAYRGAGMRNLDDAVAESRPANLGFKIGEYGEKNDPRLPNTGLFGVNDFRRAQGMTYTDPQGNPWKAGVSDTMHPFMDAETALQVDRANTAGTGGRKDWQGPHIQEVPWVYGKAQDLYSRGLKGRYAGDELEGIKQSLRDANNTARDYFYKNIGSATHEAIPGASTGHVPSMINAPFEEKLAYGNTGRWDVPAPEYALSDMGTVGAGNRDAIYGALGYRQLPTIEASGAYFPEGAKVAEHQPVKIARPLLDFPTGGGGIVAEPTRHAMEFAERFRALNDAQEAFGFNLPNTMSDVKGKNSLVLDTRGKNPKYLDEPHTGVMPSDQQMGALTQALGDVGYGVAPTSRGATVFPFDPKATSKDARDLMKTKGAELQKIYPSEMEPSLNTSGYGPGVGIYTPDGFKASEPFSGQATSALLKEASYLPPEIAMNLGESESVRRAIKAKIKRDAELPDARADIQETRRFFSEADWPKAVALIRQGYTPAAALAALGYSASSMAKDRR
jgi:hypothetical protein